MSQLNQPGAKTRDSTPLDQSIQSALDADLSEVKQLLALLQDEQAAMETRDRTALGAIVEAKTACLIRIEQQARTRYQLLQSLQRSTDETSWKMLVEEQVSPDIQKIWKELLHTLDQCRHHNEVNGRMISRGQQTLHNLLSIIRGQVDPPGLYNQRGGTETQQSGHSFTSA